MYIRVSTGLHALNANDFMWDQRITDEGDPLVRFTVTPRHNSADEPLIHEHWNRCHAPSTTGDTLPSAWTDFHTQEMLRCLMESAEDDPGSIVQSSLLYQRAGIVHTLLHRKWVGTSQTGVEYEATHRGVLQTLPGVEAAEVGSGWCRQMKPTYATASGDSEWAIVLDARTTRQVKSNVGHSLTQERIRLFSSGLRLVKTAAIESGAEKMSLEELLLVGDRPFNPAQYIRFWLEHARDISQVDTDFFSYQPDMEVEGQYAFCHPLYGKRGSKPTLRGVNLLASGPPLSLQIEEREVSLIIKFQEVEDDFDRLVNIGFEVRENGGITQRGLHPDHLGLQFENEQGDLSFTKQGELRRTLVTTLYRDLTKAFRICAKRSRNPDHEFQQLGSLGIPNSHMFWSKMTSKTEIERDMKKAILIANGWV
jgi:hypothetical protein